jgi:uncharacterized cupredoxin-like copper-binding protein
MKKRIVALSISCAIASSTAIAGQQATNIGYGPVGGDHSVFSSVANPVNNHSALENSKVGMGSAVTVELEVSGTEGLFNNFEDVIQAAAAAGSLSQEVADGFTNNYKNASLYASSSLSIPVLVKTTDYGNISVEYSKAMGLKAKTFQHEQSNGTPLVADVQLGMQTTFTEKTELAVGFARKTNTLDVTDTFGDGAELIYGVKGRLVQTGGNVHAYNFNRYLLTGDAQKDIEDTAKAIEDRISLDSAFTADIGFRIDTPNWNTGLTVKNLIPVNVKLDRKHGDQAEADMAGAYETKYEMNSYAVIDASLYSKDKNWKLSGYAETNEHTNFAGLSEQNAGVHASYATDTAYVPDVRFGVDKNVSSDLTKYTAGLTLGFVNLDVSTSQLSYNDDTQEDFAGAVSLSVEAEF